MFNEDTALDFDIDAIMEGTESTLEMLLDDDEAFDAECEATVISDDIDDMAIDNIIGLDDLITDDDIDAIDNGKTPVNANDPIDPIEDDADAGENDPEIFRLQKDLFQNTLLSVDDIKDLREGMSIEDFTARVLQEADEMPTINMSDPGIGVPGTTVQPPVEDECGDPVCGECHHNPCICANPVEKPLEIKIDGDHKDKEIEIEVKPEEEEKKEEEPAEKHDDEGEDVSFDLDKEFEKVKDDDLDWDDDDVDFDDEINAPMNVPAGPVQPLNDGKESAEDDSKLPFAPSSTVEDTEVEDSLSKLEEGDVKRMFTPEELKELETAYAEGYAKKLDELEAMAEAAEGEEELTEEEANLLEAYEIGYKAALADILNEDTEEETKAEDEVVSEDVDDIDEMLASIQEGLEDIKIENDFEGSSINADQKDANKGLFAGMEKNVDEPGATTQNDTTLPFENVTVKSFADIEDDAKACMIK